MTEIRVLGGSNGESSSPCLEGRYRAARVHQEPLCRQTILTGRSALSRETLASIGRSSGEPSAGYSRGLQEAYLHGLLAGVNAPGHLFQADNLGSKSIYHGLVLIVSTSAAHLKPPTIDMRRSFSLRAPGKVPEGLIGFKCSGARNIIVLLSHEERLSGWA